MAAALISFSAFASALFGVEEIDEAYIRPVSERIAANLGFRIDDARVDFYGICASCARQG